MRALAVLYTLLTFGVALIIAILDVAKRDNWFERLSDAFSVLGLLLFTVFGLVKLSSEDENVICSTILSNRILRSEDDVVRDLRLKTVDDLKYALCLPYSDSFEWLHLQDCSFASMEPSGSLKLFGGMSLVEFRKTGAVIISDLVFRNILDDTGSFLEIEGSLVVKIHRDKRRQVVPDHQVVIVSAKVK